MNNNNDSTEVGVACRSLVRCWDCNGAGKVHAAFMPISLTCGRCGGRGECPEIMKEWQETGRQIKAARLERRVMLRDEAHARGVPLAMMSDAERGISNPAMLKAYPPNSLLCHQIEGDIHWVVRLVSGILERVKH